MAKATTAAQPQKLVTRLAKSSADKSAEEQSFQLEQSELQLKNDISTTKQALLKADRAVEEAKDNYLTVGSKKIVELVQEQKNLQNGLDLLIELEAELF